jgi:pimeloyl-ACP methyl ester carboxylesterase
MIGMYSRWTCPVTGAPAAIAAAAQHPGRVRAIALVGTTLPMPVSALLLEEAKNNRHEAIDMLAEQPDPVLDQLIRVV